MKQTTRMMIQRACAGALLVSLAAATNAQNTSAPPAPAQGQAAPPAAPPAAPALTADQASYLFGLTLGEQLHGIGIADLQTDAISRGVKDALAGKKSTPAERQQLNEYARAAVLASGARNKTAAQEFLSKNGKEKGVQTTPSGLQYKVIKAGDGKLPLIGPNDEVMVNYRGKLIDGTEFDSSYSRGEPAKLSPNARHQGLAGSARDDAARREAGSCSCRPSSLTAQARDRASRQTRFSSSTSKW